MKSLLKPLATAIIILGTTVSLSSVYAARDLAPLQYFHNAQPGVEQKINVGYDHIDELERKVSGNDGKHGMQHSITELYSKLDALQKQTDLDRKRLDGTDLGLGRVSKRVAFLESVQKPVSEPIK